MLLHLDVGPLLVPTRLHIYIYIYIYIPQQQPQNICNAPCPTPHTRTRADAKQHVAPKTSVVRKNLTLFVNNATLVVKNEPGATPIRVFSLFWREAGEAMLCYAIAFLSFAK
jgi:hypothetical protein